MAELAAVGAGVAATFLHDEEGCHTSCAAARLLGRKAIAIQSDVGDGRAVEDRTRRR